MSNTSLAHWSWYAAEGFGPAIGGARGSELVEAFPGPRINVNGAITQMVNDWNIFDGTRAPGIRIVDWRQQTGKTIKVEFIDRWFVKDGNVAGLALTSTDSRGNLSGATIYLLNPETWAKEYNGSKPFDTDASQRYAAYLRSVGTHEIGHAMGILGHSSNSADKMHTTGGPIVTISDRNTLVYAYCLAR